MDLAETQKQEIYLKNINTFQSKRIIYKDSDLRKAYLEVLNHEKELIEYLSPNNKTEFYFGIFQYLVASGVLSIDNTFQKKSKCIELTLEPGISIINGSGCCRNLSAHFNTIMNLINKKQRFVLAGTNYINKQYRLDDKSLEKKDAPSNIKNILLPNHIESFDKETNMLYDTFNFRIQIFDLDNQSEENYIGLVDLGFDAMINMDIEELNHNKVLLELLQHSQKLTTAKRSLWAKNDLLNLQRQCINICKKHDDAIKDFKDKVKSKQRYIKYETIKYQKDNY